MTPDSEGSWFSGAYDYVAGVAVDAADAAGRLTLSVLDVGAVWDPVGAAMTAAPGEALDAIGQASLEVVDVGAVVDAVAVEVVAAKKAAADALKRAGAALWPWWAPWALGGGALVVTLFVVTPYVAPFLYSRKG